MRSVQDYRNLLQNRNVQAALDSISKAEGTNNNYGMNFGGSINTDLSSHPGVRGFKKYFINPKTGRRDYTTASGKYQFIEPTWDRLAKGLGLKEFSPENQDLAAIKLLDEIGALDKFIQGDFRAGFNIAGGQWASLPSSTAKQRRRSMDDMLRYAMEAGGDINNRNALFNRQQQNNQQDYMNNLVGVNWNGFTTPTEQARTAYADITTGGGGITYLLTGDQGYDTMNPSEMDELMYGALQYDNNNDRERAVSNFLYGMDNTPELVIPKEANREINKIVAGL